MPNRQSKVHAIVWRPLGEPTPPALAEALERQGIQSETAQGPFEAFSRLLAARNAGAMGRVLLLVEPDQLATQEDVRRAVERFDPKARCWAFRVSGSPKLTPLGSLPPVPEPEVVIPAQSAQRSHAEGTPTPRPELRLTDDASPDPRASDPQPEDSDERSPRSVLTPEELEMLLADDRD